MSHRLKLKLNKLLIGLAFLFTGCASLDNAVELNPKIFYKPDIKLEYKDYRFGGWGVLPYDKEHFYEVKIKTVGDIDLIRISTNARLDTDEPDGHIFRSNKEYKYRYFPDYELEVLRNSLITIEAFEAGLPGRHSVGFYMVDYGMRGADRLSAITKCNGRIKSEAGISMCVTMQGLYQQIEFKNEVLLMSNSEKKAHCRLPKVKSKKKWLFKTRNRICEYTFLDLSTGLTHAHVAIGYEDVAVRRYK